MIMVLCDQFLRIKETQYSLEMLPHAIVYGTDNQEEKQIWRDSDDDLCHGIDFLKRSGALLG